MLIDNRFDFTIGRKLVDAKFMGSPYVIVLGIGLTSDSPTFELIDRRKGEDFEVNVDKFIETIQLLSKV